MSMMTFAKQRREKAEAIRAAAEKLAAEMTARAESFLAERRAQEEAELKAKEADEAVAVPAAPEAEEEKPAPKKRGRKPRAPSQLGAESAAADDADEALSKLGAEDDAED